MTDITKAGILHKLINALDVLEACGTEAELQDLATQLISLRTMIKKLGGKI